MISPLFGSDTRILCLGSSWRAKWCLLSSAHSSDSLYSVNINIFARVKGELMVMATIRISGYLPLFIPGCSEVFEGACLFGGGKASIWGIRCCQWRSREEGSRIVLTSLWRTVYGKGRLSLDYHLIASHLERYTHINLFLAAPLDAPKKLAVSYIVLKLHIEIYNLLRGLLS